jgi:hypothetical protein
MPGRGSGRAGIAALAVLGAGLLSAQPAELPPEAHGLRLGMSLVEARRVFPELREMPRGFAESAREDEGPLLYHTDDRKTEGFHVLTMRGTDRVCRITLADERVLSVEAAREHVQRLRRLWGGGFEAHALVKLRPIRLPGEPEEKLPALVWSLPEGAKAVLWFDGSAEAVAQGRYTRAILNVISLDPGCERANRFVKPELADPGAEKDVIPRFLRLVAGEG